MSRRLVSLLGFVLLALLSSFALPGQSQSKGRSNYSARPAGIAAKHQGASNRQASAKPRFHSMAQPAPASIGFLSATQWAVGGSPNSPYPSVMPGLTESFDSLGNTGVATVVNYNVSKFPKYAISVVLSNGDGTFQAPQLTDISDTQFNPIWTGNLDASGNGDAVIILEPATASTVASINVWVNNGDGTFSLGGNYPLTTVNGDNIVWGTTVVDPTSGYVDFVAVDAANPATVWTLAGNNSDGFSAPTSASAASGQLSNVAVAFANFSNHSNGLLDFVGTDVSSNQLMVYINNGAGYNAPVALPTPDGKYDACSIAAGDLNGDGIPEIVAANCQDNNVTIYVNNGTGGFAAPTTYYYAGRLPEAITIADMNGDGKNDIVAADAFGGDVSVLLGNGDGTVQQPSVGYATGGYPGGNPFGPTYSTVPPLVADFQNRGILDVMVADSFFSFVYLPGYGDGSFQSAIDYYAPIGVLNPFAAGMASGDFNGDGVMDYVIGNNKSYSGGRTGITVFLGNPDGSMKTGVPQGGVATNGVLAYVAVADFQKRGILDIVATDMANGGIQMFSGNGDGTFQTANTAGTDNQPGGYSTLGIAVGDFNGDGYPDIAVVNAYNSGANLDVGVLINDKQGGFNPVLNYSINNTSQAGANQIIAEITAADLNGDGKLDLLVPNFGTETNFGATVAVLYGNGDGTFQAESDINTTTNPRYAAVADLNGDGIPDLILSVDDGATNFQGIDIYLQNPVGTFTLAYQYGTQQDTSLHVPVPTYVRVANVNGDGNPDLVYTNSNYGTVGILYGKGTGQFNLPIEYPVGGNSYNLELADVNHGGAVNVVTADGNASELTVLLNTAGAPNTIGSSLNPSTAGMPVTFTATVSAIRGVSAVPTGSVTFYDGSTALGQPVQLNVGPSSSTASFTASLTGGAHSITSQYSGDSNFFPSTSVALKQSVSLASSAAAVGSSLNPAFPKQSVTFTATVTDSQGGDSLMPTGSVTFYDGSTALGSPALNSQGVAILNTSSLAVGSHNITAQYSGDSNFSVSSAQMQQTVSLAASAASLGSSLNPAAPKQSVTFTAKVINNQQGYSMQPTGSVTFYDGSKALGSAALGSTDVATLTTSSLATGSHSITAQYSGDGNFQAAGSQAVNEIITLTPDYSLLPSPDSRTVNPGSTASYSISLTPVNDYNGAVSFACPSQSSLPSGVTCKAPAQMNSPYQPGTLMLKTTGPSATVIAPQDLKPHRGEPNLWASLGGVGMLGIVLAGDWKKRNRRRMAIMLIVLALAMVLAMVGCGGGSPASTGGGGGGQGGTPAGTYHVTITATGTAGSNFGNTTPHQFEVTLIVN